MNEIFQKIAKEINTGNSILDFIVLISITLLFYIIYLRLSKVDFNPDHFKNKKKFLELNQYNELSSGCKDYFKNDFINNRQAQLLFEIDTGIATHHNSINNYIFFYEQLGNQFSWNNIKNVKQYLIIKGYSLAVKIPKIELILYNTVKVVIYINFISVLVLFHIYLFAYNQIDKETKILLLSLTIILCITLLALMISQNSINNAISIQKRINELKHSKEDLEEIKTRLINNTHRFKQPNIIKNFNNIIIELIKDPLFIEESELFSIHSKTENLDEVYDEVSDTINKLNFEIIKINTNRLLITLENVINKGFN